ncbi:hypothetical protein CSC94_11225 [Zhengella mangrovi]|uniref:Uncharacterized protein n=1 Tax=Zhengella mangrovi TaxID=1982044 RepID=A0A2G1QNR4_9HYPH|nr:hypothetical protein [Zhengella mangrovi]PHP67111.1 hypothetical protein CSC94_11225 [Zhengella mangrovi]
MRAVLSAVLLLAGLSPCRSADIVTIATPSPVTAVAQTAQGVFVTTRGGSFRLDACAGEKPFCLLSSPVPDEPPAAPEGALPDGRVAEDPSGDIRRAWYADPTDRYGHGVLGDRIEGGSLAVIDADGNPHLFRLPRTHVFEDITPRIADLDGDGRNEVVTIRSGLASGAAIALYGLRDGQLVQLAETPAIGRPNRWLNIAAILPGEGRDRIVYAVRTPHIAGTLFSVAWDGRGLAMKTEIATDVSNHVIGSREQGLAWGGVVEKEHPAILVLPSQDRRKLRFAFSSHADIRLPGAIDKAIVEKDGWLVTATENGRLLVIRR